MFDTEKCCVEIEFKACFRDFLRCSRYSSCERDKLSKTGEFYLHYLRGCKISALLFCASACHIARRFEFCAAFGILHMCRLMFVLRALRVLLGVQCSRFAPPALGYCVLCLRRATLRVASYVVWHSHLEFYVRRLASHLASSLEISCEVVCASFDAIARICVLRVSRVRSSVRKLSLAPSTCAALRLLPSMRHAASDARR